MKRTHGSSLDSLFDELGERAIVDSLATKKILALQAARRMRELKLSKARLARRMSTSRNQVLRILSPDEAGITLKVLFRLSHALGMRLRVGLETRRRPKRR